MKIYKEDQIQNISKNLLDLFWDLQESNIKKRLCATTSLLKIVLSKQQNGDEQLNFELEYSYSRLMQGLASSRKQVKLGFVTALTNLLHKTSSSLMNSKKFLFLIENQLAASHIVTKKNGLKDLHLGRLFCFLSLIKSQKLINENDCESMAHTVESLLKLSNKKPYFKSMSYYGIQELVKQASTQQFKEGIWSLLFTILKNGWKNCSIEVLHLLITCALHHPDTCGNNFLKTCGWIEKDSVNCSILNEYIHDHLCRIFSDTTSCHPQINNLIFEILSFIGKQSNVHVVEFWQKSLHEYLIKSTSEKKYLGFHIAIHLLSFISSSQISIIWSDEVIANLYFALSHKHHSLNKLCSTEIPKILSKKLKEESVDSEVQFALLFRLFSNPAGVYLDQARHTSIISSIVSNFKLPALLQYISWLKKLFIDGTNKNCGIQQLDIDEARKWSMNQLCRLVKTTSLPRYENWMLLIVNFIVFHAYFSVISSAQGSSILELDELNEDFINLSDACRSQVMTNCTNLLNFLINMEPIASSVEGAISSSERRNESVYHGGAMSSGNSWLHHVLNYVSSLFSMDSVKLVTSFDEQTCKAWTNTVTDIKKMAQLRKSHLESSAEARLLELLLCHVGFRLLSCNLTERSFALDTLADLSAIIAQKFGKKTQYNENSPHWVEVLVEIILSLLVSESRSICSVAEQAFRILCPYLTKEAMKLILDALLILNPGDFMDIPDGDNNENDETDEDSNKPSESDEDDDDDNSDDECGDGVDGIDSVTNQINDVDHQFRLKIKEALGEAAIADVALIEGSSESDAELSDDAMMKLDPVLSEIFKQRKKPSRTSSHQQMVTFQARCLHLIEIFLSRQHDNSHLMLDLTLPLLKIIQQTSTKPHKQIIAEQATVILKVKLCRSRNLPRHLDLPTITCCQENVKKLLAMSSRESHGVFIDQLISQCCLLQIRALLTCAAAGQEECSEALHQVCELYSQQLDQLMQSKQSKVHQCLITDFINQQPALAHCLAHQLVKYTVDAVRPYRRLQASQMLTSLCRSKQLQASMLLLSPLILKTVHKFLKSFCRSDANENPCYLLQLIRLLQFSVQTMLNKEQNWSDLIETLSSFSKMPIVKRSQALDNCIWGLLKKLGVSRVKRTKERKRKSSAILIADDCHQPKTKEDPVKYSEGESSRKKKRRIMREKRKGAGRRPKPKKQSGEAEQIKDAELKTEVSAS